MARPPLGSTRASDDAGFTLIELMVVVLIIAILLAIAVPTYLGARNTANARAAQSDLGIALTGENAIYSQRQAFSADTTSALPGVEAALNWTTGTPGTTVANQVGVIVGDSGNAVVVSATGKDGNCYMIRDVVVADTSYPTAGNTYVKAPGACGAPNLTLPSGAGVSSGGTMSAAAW